MTPYYTHDITGLTWPSLWRLCWRLYGPFGLPVLAYFAFCKLLGLRGRARWGSPRPERIDRLPADALPSTVRAAFEPAEQACRAAGMRHAYYMKAPHIGGKQAYAAAYLSADGTFYASVIWTHFAYGGRTRTVVVFACHTRFAGG